MKEISFEPFNAAIEKYDLKKSWRDGLFTRTEEERQQREKVRYEQAKQAYSSMMRSSKNDGSTHYLNWALGKALNIKAVKTTFRQSLNGKIQSN